MATLTRAKVVTVTGDGPYFVEFGPREEYRSITSAMARAAELVSQGYKLDPEGLSFDVIVRTLAENWGCV